MIVNCSWSMVGGAACSKGNTAFFHPYGCSEFYSFNCDTKEWDTLPGHLDACFSLRVIKDQLTTVGGENSNKLFSYNETHKEWKESYPPMSTVRRYPAVACAGRYVVVAGGCSGEEVGEIGEYLSSVEVMDTDARLWYTVASLPRPMGVVSMAARRDKIYVLGDETTNVYHCSILSLLRPSDNHDTWTRLADLPVSNSTVINLGGKLICVGGCNDEGTDINTVFYYDTPSGTWEEMGHVPGGVYFRMLVATLPGDRLIVGTNVGDLDNTSCSINVARCKLFFESD